MDILDLVRFWANGGASRPLTPTWAFKRSVETSKWLLSSIKFKIYLASMIYKLAVASHFVLSTKFGTSGKTQEMLFVIPPHSMAASDFLTERMLTIYSVSSIVTQGTFWMSCYIFSRQVDSSQYTTSPCIGNLNVQASHTKPQSHCTRERWGETSSFCGKDGSV